MIEYPHVACARRYVDDVLSGQIVVCRWVKLACERSRRDLEASDAPATRTASTRPRPNGSAASSSCSRTPRGSGLRSASRSSSRASRPT